MSAPTRLLITLCNKHRCPDVAPGVLLCEVKLASGEVRGVSFGDALEPDVTGITGVARFEDRFIFGLQARSSKLLVTDDGLNALEVVPLHHTRDIHSILSSHGFAFMASTGTDQLTSWTPGTPDVVVATLGSGDRDTVHFNSMTSLDDRLIVSMFGPQVDGNWLQTHHGRIQDVETGEKLSDANHPHSLGARDGELVWCESNEQRLATPTSAFPLERGYTRGLGLMGERIVVGSSVRRTHSRSTGRAIGTGEEGECGLTYMSWPSGLPISEARPERFISLMDFGREIYDVLPD